MTTFTLQSGEAAAHGAGGEGEGEHAGCCEQDQPPRLGLLHQLFKGIKMTEYLSRRLVNRVLKI
jgi:hypothetical protein